MAQSLPGLCSPLFLHDTLNHSNFANTGWKLDAFTVLGNKAVCQVLLCIGTFSSQHIQHFQMENLKNLLGTDAVNL